MSHDVDLSEEFGDELPDTPVLPPLAQLYGTDAAAADIDLAAMIDHTTDPTTPAPDGELIPTDPATDPLLDAPFLDALADPDALPDSDFPDPLLADDASDPADDLGGADDLDASLDTPDAEGGW